MICIRMRQERLVATKVWAAQKGGSTQKFIWPWMRLVCRSEPLLRMAQELTVKKLFRWFKICRAKFYWPTVAMIRIKLSNMRKIPAFNQSFLRKNRKVQRKYDKNLYKKRHLVENASLRLKRSRRGIATRYLKRLSPFVAFVHLACPMDWLKFI